MEYPHTHNFINPCVPKPNVVYYVESLALLTKEAVIFRYRGSVFSASSDFLRKLITEFLLYEVKAVSEDFIL